MPACAMAPADRRKQIQAVGNDLVKHHGKKKFYTVDEVKAANRRQRIDYDVGCWSHAFFNTHADFDAYHAELGEPCDYAEMKRELLTSVMTNPEPSSVFDLGFDFDLSWLELPDIDWSIFDFLDF
jgi:hypothetical protein